MNFIYNHCKNFRKLTDSLQRNHNILSWNYFFFLWLLGHAELFVGFGRFLFCLAGGCICFVVVVFIIARILQDVYTKTAD